MVDEGLNATAKICPLTMGHDYAQALIDALCLNLELLAHFDLYGIPSVLIAQRA